MLTATEQRQVNLIFNKIKVRPAIRVLPTSPKHFPEILKEEYAEGFKQFLKTQVASDLRVVTSYQTTVNVLTCLAYVSHLDNIGGQSIYVRGHKVNVPELAKPLMQTYVTMAKRQLQGILSRYGTSRHFYLSRSTAVVDHTVIDFIQCLSDVTVSGNLVLRASKHVSMSAAIALLTGTMFSRVPVKLSNVNKNKFLQEKTLLKATSLLPFHKMIKRDDLELYVARSQGDSLVIKYTIVIPMVSFYRSPADINKQTKSIEKVFSNFFL